LLEDTDTVGFRCVGRLGGIDGADDLIDVTRD
jgi:hypothetical protein